MHAPICTCDAHAVAHVQGAAIRGVVLELGGRALHWLQAVTASQRDCDHQGPSGADFSRHVPSPRVLHPCSRGQRAIVMAAGVFPGPAKGLPGTALSAPVAPAIAYTETA